MHVHNNVAFMIYKRRYVVHGHYSRTGLTLAKDERPMLVDLMHAGPGFKSPLCDLEQELYGVY